MDRPTVRDPAHAIAELDQPRRKPPWLEGMKSLPFAALTPAEFEVLCFLLLRREHPEVEVLYYGKTGDGGRDVVVRPAAGAPLYFQCKHYAGRVGVDDVRAELAKLFSNLHAGLFPDQPSDLTFMLTSDLTAQAQDLLDNQVAWKTVAPKALEKHLGEKPDADLLRLATTWWPRLRRVNGVELSDRIQKFPELIEQFFSFKKVVDGNLDEIKKLLLSSRGNHNDTLDATAEQQGVSGEKEQEIPDEIKTILRQAIDAVNRQDFGMAIPLSREAKELSDAGGYRSASARARVALGNALYHTGGGSAVITLFFEALQLTPAGDRKLRYHILLSLGEVLGHEGRAVESEAALELARQEAQQLPPECLAATESALGSLALREKKLDEALEHFHDAERRLAMAAMASSGDSGQYVQPLGIAKVGLGDVLFQQKKYLEAIKVYEAAVATFGRSDAANHAIAKHQLGKVFAVLHRNTEAIEQLAEAAKIFAGIEMYPPLLQALDKLAELHMKHRNWDSAHEVCQQLLVISPRAPLAKRIEIIRLVARVLGAMHLDILPDSNELLQQAFNGLSKARELAEQHGFLDQVAACAVQAFHLARKTLSDDVIEGLRIAAIAALRPAITAQREPRVAAGMYLTLSEFVEGDRERYAALSAAKRLIEADPDRDLELLHLIDARLGSISRAKEEQETAYRALLDLPDSSEENQAEAHHMLFYSAIQKKLFREADSHLERLRELAGERHNALKIAYDCEIVLKHAKLARRGASLTLAELLDSLGQLLQINKESPRTVRCFWYFLWVHELTNLLRSGSNLTILAVGIKAAEFLEFAQFYDSLSDYFLMADLNQPALFPEDHVLSLPESWRFPDSFDFVAFTSDGRFWRTHKQKPPLHPDALPSEPVGGPLLPHNPAFRDSMPDYTLITHDGKEGIYALRPFPLQAEGAELMLGTSIVELTQRRALWAPIDAFKHEDKLLSILLLAHGRGYVPVFFNRWPLSEQVEKKAGLVVGVPQVDRQATFHRLKTTLLRILQAGPNSVSILYELSTLGSGLNQPGSLAMEIALFEINEQESVLHPAVLLLQKASP